APMRSRPIRSKLVLGFLSVVALGTASPQKAAGATGVPSCTDYQTNTFLTDAIVTDELLAERGSRTIQPPCTEAVNGDKLGRNQPGGPGDSLAPLFDATRTPLERLQNGFDLYSWLSFVSLNLPADATIRFGTSDAQTVWEKTFAPLDA